MSEGRDAAAAEGQRGAPAGERGSNEEGRDSRLGSAMRGGAKLLAGGATVYHQAKGAVTTAAMVGANRVATAVDEHVSEERKHQVREKVTELKGVYKEKVDDVTERVVEGIHEGRAVAAKASADAYAALPPDVRQRFENEKRAMEARLEKVKAAALDFAGPLVDKSIVVIMEKAKKSVTADPDMPQCAKRRITAFLDDVIPDVQLELGAAVHKAVLKSEEREPGPVPHCCYPSRWRAFFLYHFLPYDKSPWAMLKDPFYWLFLLITLVPVFGVRVFFFSFVLLMITMPCPPDEFQLIQFIQKFKGFQFITGGVLKGLVGAYTYYACLNFEVSDSCHQNGPGAQGQFVVNVLEFFLSMVLVWVAFLLMPYSEKKGGEQFTVETDHTKAQEEGGKGTCCCGLVTFNTTRGGRLTSLLKYDLCVFLVCGVFVTAMTVVNATGTTWKDEDAGSAVFDWRFGANLYWAIVLYSLLSFPFVFFSIPVLKNILTHARETGFAPSGECVAKKIEFVDEEEAARGAEQLQRMKDLEAGVVEPDEDALV